MVERHDRRDSSDRRATIEVFEYLATEAFLPKRLRGLAERMLRDGLLEVDPFGSPRLMATEQGHRWYERHAGRSIADIPGAEVLRWRP